MANFLRFLVLIHKSFKNLWKISLFDTIQENQLEFIASSF